ncbi:MAG: hypothetical protein M1823_001404 [Watsoniomyces obsoletus]|nr:MAG: hypothetical protein M1823_001404 [Watsoniomyces obsoletus]
MKLTSSITIWCSCTVLAQALSLPDAAPRTLPDAYSAAEAQESSLQERSESSSSLFPKLWKRRGGGGSGGGSGGSSGGGGGGGGGRGSSSSSGSSGSSSSGSRSGGSSGSTGGSRISPSSNAGGATRSGSGPLPRFGGGKFYGGGAARPYRSGGRSPAGITPFLLPIAALTFFPGLWLYAVYAYPYSRPYVYRNASRLRDDDDDDLITRSLLIRQSNNPNGTVQILPVLCLCQQYSVCGCDDNTDSEFLNSLLPNGTASPQLNETVVRISDINGTRTLVLNGTLPNGTTAPGGDDGDEPINAGQRTSEAARSVLESAGWWVMVAIVSGSIWFM